MKEFAFAFVLIAVCSGMAFAQGGTLGLFADTGAGSCSFTDRDPGLVQLHVVHLFMVDAGACAFKVAVPACATGLTWIGDTSDFFKIGFSPTGITVAYGDCKSSPIHVIAINYWGLGQAQECCWFTLEPDPRQPEGKVIVQTCGRLPETFVPTITPAVLNGNALCPCMSVPVEKTTWGRVKELHGP